MNRSFRDPMLYVDEMLYMGTGHINLAFYTLYSSYDPTHGPWFTNFFHYLTKDGSICLKQDIFQFFQYQGKVCHIHKRQIHHILQFNSKF